MRPARVATLNLSNSLPQSQSLDEVFLSILQISSAEGAGRAVSWGFPRGITQREMNCDQWWMYQDRAIGWLEPCVPGVFAPHLVIHPAHRRRFLPLPRVWAEFQQKAVEAVGHCVLVVVPPYGAVGPFLTRLGFTLNPDNKLFIREIGAEDG